MNLTLETKPQPDMTPVFRGPPEPSSTPGDRRPKRPVMLLTPTLGGDYWLFRVQLSESQAIIGFPKFGTIGIGFAKEAADWNTNLPYTCETERIFAHIACNKGDDTITDADCIAAIRMIQAAAIERAKG